MAVVEAATAPPAKRMSVKLSKPEDDELSAMLAGLDSKPAPKAAAKPAPAPAPVATKPAPAASSSNKQKDDQELDDLLGDLSDITFGM